MNKISLVEFYYQLEKHDWTHHFSDSIKKVREGEANEGRLRILASENGKVYDQLFYDYYCYKQFQIHDGNLIKPEKPIGYHEFIFQKNSANSF